MKRRSTLAVGLVAVMASTLVPSGAIGATIGLQLETQNSGPCAPGTGLTELGGPGQRWVLSRSTTDVGGGLSASATCQLDSGPLTTMSAVASFDRTLMLGAYSSTRIPAGADPFSQVWTEAWFTDTVTLVGGPIGTPGTLVMSFVLDGVASGAAGALLSYSGLRLPGGGFRGPGPGTLRIPLVFGTAQELTINLWVTAYGGDNPSSSPRFVFADFLHTATLMSATVLDSDGVELPDGRVISDAGLDYAGGTEPVPEPASVFLFGTGLLGLARRARRG